MDDSPLWAVDRPLPLLLRDLRGRLAAGAEVITIHAVDPDRGRGLYAGERLEIGGRSAIHRPYRAWIDLGERLGLRLCTPTRIDEGLVALRFERLAPAAPWRGDDDPRERYGAASEFQRISRLEDPDLLMDIGDALARIGLGPRPRILDLGANNGEMFALLCALEPRLAADAAFVAVDHCASALALAEARLSALDLRLIYADLGELASLDLGAAPFDLVIAMGALQSPGVDDRALLRHLVQARLGPGGALLLGYPNCRYQDGERRHGARIKNLREAELSLLIDDIAFVRRYLHQHRRRVYVTGRDYVLVTAVAAGAAGRGSP